MQWAEVHTALADCLLSGSVVDGRCVFTVCNIRPLIRLTEPRKAFKSWSSDSPTSEPELTLDRGYFVNCVKSTALKYRVANLQSDRKTRMTGMRIKIKMTRSSNKTETSREIRKTRKSTETRGRVMWAEPDYLRHCRLHSFSCFLLIITNGSSWRNLS